MRHGNQASFFRFNCWTFFAASPASLPPPAPPASPSFNYGTIIQAFRVYVVVSGPSAGETAPPPLPLTPGGTRSRLLRGARSRAVLGRRLLRCLWGARAVLGRGRRGTPRQDRRQSLEPDPPLRSLVVLQQLVVADEPEEEEVVCEAFFVVDGVDDDAGFHELLADEDGLLGAGGDAGLLHGGDGVGGDEGLGVGFQLVGVVPRGEDLVERVAEFQDVGISGGVEGHRGGRRSGGSEEGRPV
mmetsp:Transcript_19504/g.51869  ORF Transcript_19504/g.51869 Transcript_19504/m.51869 type:complete len:242 (+) Transcript_19504:183-908(+)